MSNNPVTLEQSWRPDLRAPIVMVLAGLLVLQLLLALGLGLGSGRALAPGAANTPLLEATPEAARRIQILSADGATTLTLVKEEPGWILPELGDAPVLELKVEQLLGALAELMRPLPIATSESARQRFKVADTAFERRLIVEDDSERVLDLLIGDSPGFRRVYGRLAGEPGVYDLRLAQSDISTRADDWVDPGLLRLETAEIERIASRDWTLTKGADGAWTLADTDQPLALEAVDALVMRIANLSYRGILGINDDPGYNQQDPELVLTIDLVTGEQREYRISRLHAGPDHVLKDSAQPWYFKLTELDLGELLETAAADLIDTPARPDSAEPVDALPEPEHDSTATPESAAAAAPTADTAHAGTAEETPMPADGEPTPATMSAPDPGLD
ncbi:MAG: DUF4340 domain-containing protein [Gammaproteobacteria bacterium]|nr:DUF4340 domain-containing protein [Gammaproteobacteria bacterium]